MYNKGRN